MRVCGDVLADGSAQRACARADGAGRDAAPVLREWWFVRLYGWAGSVDGALPASGWGIVWCNVQQYLPNYARLWGFQHVGADLLWQWLSRPAIYLPPGAGGRRAALRRFATVFLQRFAKRDLYADLQLGMDDLRRSRTRIDAGDGGQFLCRDRQFVRLHPWGNARRRSHYDLQVLLAGELRRWLVSGRQSGGRRRWQFLWRY